MAVSAEHAASFRKAEPYLLHYTALLRPRPPRRHTEAAKGLVISKPPNISKNVISINTRRSHVAHNASGRCKSNITKPLYSAGIDSGF
jgi:hypothetical protein